MVTLSLEKPTSQESFTVPFPMRPFSVVEYEAMGKAGVLDEDDNVELLEGWIVPKMTKNPFHDSVITQLDEDITSQLVGYHIRVQCAIATTDSEPEPDLAVVRGSSRDYTRRHPTADDVALIIEVSDSSVSRDRVKARIYAKAGILQYWIVNLVDRVIEVFTEAAISEEPHYQTGMQFAMEDTLDISLSSNVRIVLPVKPYVTQ